jgi:hypothetical protein
MSTQPNLYYADSIRTVNSSFGSELALIFPYREYVIFGLSV